MTQPKRSVAELPSGGPSDRGLPLDPGIPGSATHSKPVDDVRKPDVKDESIHRVEDANSITKDRDRIDTNEDNADQNTSFNGLGDSEATSKTKYPYRDGIPNAHNAAFIAEMWKLENARIATIRGGDFAKVSSTIDEMMQGLDEKFQQRAKSCKATLKRVDVGNRRWIFSVDCGNGPKAVKLKALSDGRIRQFNKLDLEVSCSCPAWKWLGPEYHATSETFLLGKARGTAAPPDIRDPERDNRVCKHVAAALSVARAWTLSKPNTRLKKALKKVSDARRAVKKALLKRAALVEKATEILMADPNVGYKLSWEGAPHAVYVRARGSVDDGLFRYQFRKEGSEKWPPQWIPIKDPGSWVKRLCLGYKWLAISSKTREQLLRAN